MTLKVDGFRFGGVAAKIKASGKPDVALLVCDRLASTAAVFTSNRMCAAPVQVSKKTLSRAKGHARAIVINSGNANACTGAEGLKDAQAMAARAAAALEVPAGHVLVASTGVIGHRLPMKKVNAGIDAAAASATANGFDRFAEAILTTDKRAKTASVKFTVGGQTITLLGCTKGAGMISPNMATTLTYVATDAAVPPAALDAALRKATAETYNAITVDGDTSTNDMIAVMASGAKSNGPLRGANLTIFGGALRDLLDDLAHMLMADGEGVGHVVTVKVVGARTRAQGQLVARTVANSPLVKTAIAGGDPNWGRILCAVGNAGVPVKPDRVDLAIGGVAIVKNGVGVGGNADKAAAKAMNAPRYDFEIDLHAGRAEGRYLACDLTHDYVTINADYRT